MYKNNANKFFLCAIVSSCLMLFSPLLIADTGMQSDRLDIPAAQSSQVAHTLKLSVASHKDTVVAVGLRGEVSVSFNAGESFSQSQVMLSSDLTTTRFTQDGSLWVLGHDAVLLRSNDLGLSWQRVLDGRSTFSMLNDYYQQGSNNGDEEAAYTLRDIKRTVDSLPTADTLPYPFFDISINQYGQGFAVGAFGLLLKTKDGGLSWQPWMEKANNAWAYHIYAVQQQGDDVYLAGERGFLRRLNEEKDTFERVETPFDGTYFGLFVNEEVIQVYGLRGKVFSSKDGGENWQEIKLDTDSTVVSMLTPESGDYIYVTQKGELIVYSEKEQNIIHATTKITGEVTSAALVGNNKIALAQYNGIQTVLLSSLFK